MSEVIHVPASVPAGRRLANAAHERFARLCLEHTQAEAYRRAFGKELRAKPQAIWTAACRLAARPDVARRVTELRALAARDTAIDLAARVTELRDIESADPTEIQYHPCCRWCFGDGHAYQWIDMAEYAGACDEALALHKPLPSLDGGTGYDGALHPNPSCPQCFGAGAPHLFTADVTRLSPKARRLFKGFGKHGEVLLHDQMAARTHLSRILGLDRDDPANIAKAAALGAAAGATLGASVAAALTPEEKMRAYSRLIEG